MKTSVLIQKKVQVDFSTTHLDFSWVLSHKIDKLHPPTDHTPPRRLQKKKHVRLKKHPIFAVSPKHKIFGKTFIVLYFLF